MTLGLAFPGQEQCTGHCPKHLSVFTPRTTHDAGAVRFFRGGESSTKGFPETPAGHVVTNGGAGLLDRETL